MCESLERTRHILLMHSQFVNFSFQWSRVSGLVCISKVEALFEVLLSQYNSVSLNTKR